MVLATKTKRPNTSISHKKRHGQHRKQTKPFMKTYWPYLPIFLIFSCGLLLNNNWSRQSAKLSLDSAALSSSSLLNNINNLRSKDNLNVLSANDSLSSAAQLEANQISVSSNWSSTSLDNESLASSVRQAGYDYQSIGENLSYGLTTSQSLVTAWDSNQSYRSGLLNPSYQNAGFGIALSQNFNNQGPSIIVVALYGQPKLTEAVPITDQSQNIQLTSLKAPSHSVVFAQVFFKQYSYIFVIVLPLLVFGSLAVFIIRHSLIWHKALVKGEQFVIKNPWLDVMIVSVGTLSFLLGHTIGGIQ
ncbi:MAG TPA: CAP domain-containing protein [Candidatus Saccharimonadales bacterium]|nr:CAP domain-containing protein [Candidatus Saccharimonadales bacterium]